MELLLKHKDWFDRTACNSQDEIKLNKILKPRSTRSSFVVNQELRKHIVNTSATSNKQLFQLIDDGTPDIEMVFEQKYFSDDVYQDISIDDIFVPATDGEREYLTRKLMQIAFAKLK